MSFIRQLEPKNTEEVKPGIFLQKTRKGWRQVYPAAWNGKINWKNFVLGGPNFWKTLVWFAIILFLIFAYYHDVQQYKEFYKKYNSQELEQISIIDLENYSHEFEKKESEVFKQNSTNISDPFEKG